jgi:hypothetical protein
MKEGLEALTKFVKVVMSYRPERKQGKQQKRKKISGAAKPDPNHPPKAFPMARK